MADRAQHTWVDELFVAEDRARAEAAGVEPPKVAPPPEPVMAAVEEPAEPVAAAAAHEAHGAPPREPKVRTPRVNQHRIRRAFAAARSRVAADLAAHWLAYIGVVLIFVGVFGFMVFSFRDVGRNWRPVAEVMIPLALAGAAWYLRRQRAPFVASLVAGLAGALLPIAVITSFNDDFSVPPDIMGIARPLVSGGICILIGGAYAWWTTRRPETPLRFLAAPAMWLGVGVAVGAFAADVPLGTHVARADAWQSAAMMIAIAGSLLVARWRPRHVLSQATMSSAFPGIGIVIAFVLAAIIPTGDWFGAGTAAALALLVAIDLLEPRLRATATAILDTAALVAVVLTLHPPVSGGWMVAVGFVGLLGLTEWVARRRTPLWLVQTMGALAASSLILLVAAPWWPVEPWAVVAGFAVASAWGHVARVVPRRWVTEPELVVVAAIAAPFGFAYGLSLAVSNGVAVVVLAGIVLAVAVFVRVDRDVDDPFWRAWIPGAAGVVEAMTVAVAVGSDPMYAWLAGAAALLTVTAAIMPMAIAWRRWIAGAAFVWTAWLTAMAFDIGMTGPAIRTATLAVATVVTMVVATRMKKHLVTPLALVAAALGLGTLGSLGAWRAWDLDAWTIGLAAYGGAVVVGVLGSTFIARARRALTWPWGVAAAATVAGAVAEVITFPHRVGAGAPGYAAAGAAMLLAAGSWTLVRRWKVEPLVDLGAVALVAAGASLAVAMSATAAEIAVAAMVLGAIATVWTVVVGPRRTEEGKARLAPMARLGFEFTVVGGVAAVRWAPFVGDLGWLGALAFAVITVESFALAVRWRVPDATFLSAFGAVAAVLSFGAWAGWANETWLMVAAVGTAAMVVLATGAATLLRIGRAWAIPWIGVGLTGSGMAVAVALVDVDGMTRGTPGYVVAGATLAVAVVGVLADRWQQAMWRWVAAIWIGLAAAVAAVAGDLGTVGIARGAAITAIAVTVLVVATWRVAALESWHRAGTALAALALAAAIPGTLVAVDSAVVWSEVASLVTLVLFACAIESWTFGTLWHKPFLAESAPFWLVAAWCAFAAGSLSGNAQWYTVPIGVALIGVEEIRRSDHRRAGLPPYSVSGRWIEYLGMMLIVGASLFQTVTVSMSYALIGIVLGMLIATWGALTHVRRRAVFGTMATLLAVVLMLAVPLAGALPNMPGIAVWVTVAAIGVIAVTSAAFIERGRHAWRSGVRRFGSVTHDWE